MATLTKSARPRTQKTERSRPGARTSARAKIKSAKSPAKPKRGTATATRAKAERPERSDKGDPARLKKFAQVFGPVLSKAAIAAEEGDAAELAALAKAGLCVLQFSPRPDRMSWVSLTHGLSAARAKGAVRPELLVHWRQRDGKLPVRVLAEAARYALLENPADAHAVLISAGDERPLRCEIALLPHWLICGVDKLIAEQFEKLDQMPPVALVLGITDGEFQACMRVRPELADGRKVLLEALRLGQVYPITDPGRTCLTRRRDFHRIWESAFQTVRTGK